MSDPYRSLKNAFGRFATGVTVVSCCDQNSTLTAITVNSFASVSLDPPMVLWCVEKRASAFERFANADNYAVSILKAGDESLSNRFAAHDPKPLAADEYDVWETGAPLLRRRLAGFDCSVKHRFDAGDHVILVGQVLQFDSEDGAPLLYFASNYATGPATQ